MRATMSKEDRVKIRNFTNLNAWKESHRLYVEIYKVTKSFPKNEVYGLMSQVRRAALSVSSNITEGFGRDSAADRAHFYTMSRGSLFEVQNQLLAARDTQLIDVLIFDDLFEQSQVAQRILIGLINSTKARIT